MRHFLFTVLISLVLSGCGVAYLSSTVQENGDANVRVIPVTPETVLAANRSTYDPQALPRAFSTIAGSPNQPRGAGALPDPVFDLVTRPGALETRLPAPAQPQPYTIGVGDVVLLSTSQTVNSVEGLSGLLAAQTGRQGYTVQDDGAISIPDVGRVTIGGLTLQGAEDAVFQRLVENRIDPTFSLELAEFNSRRVSVGGAVASPAIVPIALLPLYLEEALTLAGGVAVRDRDAATVRLYRNGSLFQIPATELYSASGLRQVLLLDGDSVFVDTSYDLDAAEAYFGEQITLIGLRQQARSQAMQELQFEISLRSAALQEERSNFRDRLEFGAEDRDYVYVIGEVGTQSRFALPYGNTAVLADALLENGGITPLTGNPAQIYVLRGSPDPRDFASITALHLDITNATNFLLATRLELRRGDVIFVAEQPITRWNRALQQAIPTLNVSRTLAN
jgi:polysaccharide export outer membrane protein